MQVGSTTVAADVLETYFLELKIPKHVEGDDQVLESRDQFVCRAWYAKALVRSVACVGQTGQALVDGVQEALGYLLKGLAIAVAEPRYLFLVYEASVHYSRISRPLHKTGTRRHLVEYSAHVVSGLEKISGHEHWRAHTLRLHALCLSDAGKNDEALQVATNAHGLCNERLPSLGVLMVKLKSHIGALSGKKEAGDGAVGALALAQYVRSGACATAEEAATTLKEAWTKVDPVAASSEDETADHPTDGVDLEVVAEIGWVAAQNLALDVARQCTLRASSASTPLIRARCALTEHLISLNELGNARGTLDLAALKVHMDVVNRADDELSTFLRLQDESGIQDACQLIWTAGLPLQQPKLRHNLTRIFAAAATALEAIGSTMNRLRAALHLELAYCYIGEDSVAQAHVHVSKGLALDYIDSEDEIARTGYERPLDRYFEPLSRILTLKGSMYEDPEGIEDQALLLTEQARDAKSSKTKSNLLHAAFEKLSSLECLSPYPTLDTGDDREADEGENDGEGDDAAAAVATDEVVGPDPESIRRRATARANIWGSMVKVAADAKMLSLAHRASSKLLRMSGWDPIRDKETIVLLTEVNFIDALVCIELLKERGVALVPPRLVDTDEILDGESTTELQSIVVAALHRSMYLGASVNESWAVMNSATHIWNNYMELIKCHRYAELIPATAPLVAELCEVEDCDPVLLGNIAFVVACGYEHLALLASGASALPEDGAEGNAEETSTVQAEAHEEDFVTDYKSLRAKFASHPFEDSADMKKGIETCEMVLNRVDEVNARKLSAMIARLQASLGASSDVKVENDVVAQVSGLIPSISQPGKDLTEAGEILKQAMDLLIPEDGETQGDIEIWARLAEVALKIKSFGPAIECCKQAVQLSGNLDRRASRQNWYWSGVAECAYGNGIVGLIRPTQEESSQDALKQKAFEHFVEGAKHGRRANRSDVVGFAAKCFWNTSTSFMLSAASRKILTKPLEVILEAARLTKWDDFKFQQSMYILLFDCLVDASAWEVGVKQVDAAFKVLPSTEHKPLWEYKVMFMSTLGQNVEAELGNISEYEEEMQAKVWAGLAAQATVPYDAIRAHRRAIEVLENAPSLQVEYMVDFAEWLYSSGQPAEDAEEVLISALDILLMIENGTAGEETLRGEDSLMSLRSAQTSSSGWAKDADVQKSTPTFGTRQMKSTIRVLLILCKMSGNTVDRNDYLLMAQHYALRMLRESILVADESAKIPEALEEWADFEFSEDLLSQIRSNHGDFEISIDSVGRPELLHAYMEYLCDGLESSGLHTHCIPVCQLGIMVSKLVAENIALVCVYHLKLATLSDALFLSSASVLHEKLAGPLELNVDEMAQGRLEVKRAEMLKESVEPNSAEDSCSPMDSLKLLRPFTLRDFWLVRGAYLINRGAITAATALLQEAVGHAHAHDDTEVEAWAYFYLAKCASRGNKPIDAIKLQHCGQLCGGDVGFWGHNLLDYTKYKLNTRDGKLSAKDSLMSALKLLQNRLLFASRGSALDTKLVMSDLLVELSHVLEVEMREMQILGQSPEMQFVDSMHAVSEAVVILQDCGGGMRLVDALMSQATLMYKDPSASGDPRPMLENIKSIIVAAEVEAERVFTSACNGALYPLTASLPAARSLAVVKNAKASCLLEIARAEKALEQYDRERNRPDFPTLDGMDATAIHAFLDDSAPKSFERRLAPAEEAVVLASEAASLHKRSDGSVDSLNLLGEALLMVHDAQVNPEVWTEPPAPSTPLPAPSPTTEGADGASEEDTAPEDGDTAEGGAVVQDDASEMEDSISSAPEPVMIMPTHPELGYELLKPRAIRVLEQAIDLGLKSAKHDLASKAALNLAYAYGSADPGNAAAALALAQSCKVAESHLSIFASAADDQDVEALLIANHKAAYDTLNNTTASNYSSSLLDRLRLSSKTWNRLQINPDDCLSTPPALPEEISVFSLQWIIGRGNEVSLAIARHSADSKLAGAYVAQADSAQFAAAMNLVANYRKSVERAAIGGDPSTEPNDDDVAFDSVAVRAGWDEVCTAMEFVLAPILSAWSAFLGADGAKGKSIVLLVDEVLSPLPFEALDLLRDAASVSRDFSLHMLLKRVADSAALPDVQVTDLTFLVDLRNEDATVATQFASMREKYGPDWPGAMGSLEGIPGEGECQRLMSGARSMMYFGHGKLLSYVSPPAIACIDLSVCRLALLACNSTNKEAHATQTRLDSRKTDEEKGLDDPYKTAALLSIRGIDTVVLPTMASTTDTNAAILTNLLSANENPAEDAPLLDIATSVWKSDAPKMVRKQEQEVDGEHQEDGSDEGDGEISKESADVPFRKFVVYGLPSVKIVVPP